MIHHQSHQEAMDRMNERYLICFIVAAFVIRELWTIRDWQPGLISPFPFSNQEISRASYIWIACVNIFLLLIFFVLQQYSDKAHLFFTLLFWLQVAEFIEYFLNYNEPWVKFNNIPINVTTFRYLVLLISGLYTMIWKI